MICWVEPDGKLWIKSMGKTESFALRVLEQRYKASLRTPEAHVEYNLDFIRFDHSCEGGKETKQAKKGISI